LGIETEQPTEMDWRPGRLFQQGPLPGQVSMEILEAGPGGYVAGFNRALVRLDINAQRDGDLGCLHWTPLCEKGCGPGRSCWPPHCGETVAKNISWCKIG
jgi:hypothetical protein